MTLDPFASVPKSIGTVGLFPDEAMRRRLLGDTPTLVEMGLVLEPVWPGHGVEEEEEDD